MRIFIKIIVSGFNTFVKKNITDFFCWSISCVYNNNSNNNNTNNVNNNNNDLYFVLKDINIYLRYSFFNLYYNKKVVYYCFSAYCFIKQNTKVK